MRRPVGTFALLALLAGSALAPHATAATRLDYRGRVLPAGQVQALAAPWLRSPRDSAAAAQTLGAIVARLEDLGYLQARARGWRDSLSGDRLILDVREGARFRLREVTVHGASSEDSASLRSALDLEPGGWASPRAVDDAIAAALREIADHGYPYAELSVSGWDADSTGVRLSLEAVRGPQVSIAHVQIDGLQVTRPDFARRAMGRLVGLPYQRSTAEAARDRLQQLGLFRQVEYLGLQGDGDWRYGRLVYRVEEPHYNQFEGAVGVQGAAGTAGLARLDLGNLLGTGRELGLHWESRGRGLAQFDARYLEPLLLGWPLQLEGAVSQQLQDTLYTRTRWGARAGYMLSAQERIELAYDAEQVVQPAGDVQSAWIQNTTFSLQRSTLNDPLSPRRGTFTRISAAQIFKRETLRPSGTGTAHESAVEGRLGLNHPLRGATGLSLELSLAGRFSSESVIPIYEKYPLGGAASLRGYDEQQFMVDRYALSRAEWRWFLGGRGQRLALFWDHAFMQTSALDPLGVAHLQSAQRDGVGFGLRLEAAGGLVGVDYGLEPGRPALEGKIHLQLVTTF
ncbi:MAG TPA: BamA/TamA family outer membrane protein [Candidatus Sulfotelmatobacter sp.]|nr:BamA/TamA family outer membrane protein [Candidatus Sulfotelmatobacter sp.]